MRKTPLRRVSPDRARLLRAYSILRKSFLEVNPQCMAAFGGLRCQRRQLRFITRTGDTTSCCSTSSTSWQFATNAINTSRPTAKKQDDLDTSNKMNDYGRNCSTLDDLKRALKTGQVNPVNREAVIDLIRRLELPLGVKPQQQPQPITQ
jgi:hypothetical protein